MRASKRPRARAAAASSRQATCPQSSAREDAPPAAASARSSGRTIHAARSSWSHPPAPPVHSPHREETPHLLTLRGRGLISANLRADLSADLPLRPAEDGQQGGEEGQLRARCRLRKPVCLREQVGREEEVVRPAPVLEVGVHGQPAHLLQPEHGAANAPGKRRLHTGVTHGRRQRLPLFHTSAAHELSAVAPVSRGPPPAPPYRLARKPPRAGRGGPWREGRGRRAAHMSIRALG